MFGTPLAATLFALEVVFVSKIILKNILPVLVTSLVSFFTAHLLGAHAQHFNLSVIPNVSFSVIWKFLFLSILTAGLGIIFCLSLQYSEKLLKKLFKNAYLRIIAGAVATILLTIAVGTNDYNGAGINVIEKIFDNNQFVPLAFLLKMLFTLIAVGTGFKGGEIVPTLFIGATFGAFMGTFLGLPTAFSAAICMITLFCSATNCPLASILLACELFFGKGILYIIVTVIIGYCLSGKISLYTSQQIGGFKKNLW